MRKLLTLSLLMVCALWACTNNDDLVETQQPNLSPRLELETDQLIPVKSAWASEAQSGEGVEKSIDGDKTTIYHSRWGGATVLPVTLKYYFENVEKMDYLLVHPRSDGGSNGRFGKLEVWVTTSTKARYKYGDFDFQEAATVGRVDFIGGLVSPTCIELVVKSGAGNYVSCSEVEFYKLNPLNQSVEIPLGGNSYLTAGTGATVSDAGFTSWTGTTAVLSSYFRVNQPGALNLFLKYTVDAEGNQIEATCQGQKFTVTLPKNKTTVYLGTINKTEAGYVRVDFKGLVRNGATFANASALVVDGAASVGMDFVGDFSYYWGRRGPSVHMGYTLPVGKTVEWFYNEVTVPVGQDALGSYFMINGFSQGYCGIQVNSATERRVLFSVWSPFETDDPTQIPESHKVKLVKKGANVVTGEFGNEGAGGQSYMKFNWIAGNTYKALTRVRPSTGGYSEYTAYFFAPEVGKWQLIAQFLRPETTTYYTGAHSFLENFNNTMGYQGRRVNFNNQWAYTKDGEWIELTRGKFTVDATGRAKARMDYKGGVDSKGFFLQNCGFFNDYVAPDTWFDRTPTGKQPVINWSELE